MEIDETLNAGFFLHDWLIEPQLGSMSRAGESVRVDPRNLQVLLVLASRPGEIISQEELERAVWGDTVVTQNSLYQAVTQLRRALGDDREQRKFIETLPRRGYRLLVKPESLGTQSTITSLVSSLPPKSDAQQHSPRARSKLHVSAAIAAAVLLTVSAAGILRSMQSRESSGAVINSELAPIEHYENLLRTEGAAGGMNGKIVHYHEELASLYLAKGRLPESRSHLDRALAIQLELTGENHPSMARPLLLLSNLHILSDDYAAAEGAARRAAKIIESTSPSGTPDHIEAVQNLGRALLMAEKTEEAAAYLEKALNMTRSLYGDGNLRTWYSISDLSDLRVAQRRLGEAEELAREALTKCAGARGVGDEFTVFLRVSLADILLAEGKAHDALTEVTIALDSFRGADAESPYALSAQHIAGRALNDIGRFSEARDIFKRELLLLKRTHAAEWRIARASSALGGTLLQLNQLDEAERYLRPASQVLDGAYGFYQSEARKRTAERIQQLERTRLQQSSPRAANKQGV